MAPAAERRVALYERAPVEGAHPGITGEDERLLRSLALLALATERLPAGALLLSALSSAATIRAGA